MLKLKMHWQSSFRNSFVVKKKQQQHFLSFRLARKERDLRSIEGRLKQYETELGELKAQNETLNFDNNRKTDENVVSRIKRKENVRFDYVSIRVYVEVLVIWKNKLRH